MAQPVNDSAEICEITCLKESTCKVTYFPVKQYLNDLVKVREKRSLWRMNVNGKALKCPLVSTREPSDLDLPDLVGWPGSF